MKPPDQAGARAVRAAADRLIRRFARRRQRALLIRGLLLGGAAFMLALAGLALIDLLWPLPAQARSVLRVVPALAALAVVALPLRRLVRQPDARTLALRTEEAAPSLEGYLTTALDADTSSSVGRLFAARALARFDAVTGMQVPVHARPAVHAAAAGCALLALVLVLGGPVTVWQRWVRPADAAAAAPGTIAGRRAAAEGRAVPRISEVRWTVVPPPYTGLAASQTDGEASIDALPGSRVRMATALPPAGMELRAEVVGGPALAAETGSEWRAEWVVAGEHRGVSMELLAADSIVARRVVPLRLREDAVPEVRLAEPTDDMVLATASGRIRFVASARDDFGVTGFNLAWIHSSGSGESFSFRQGEWAFDRVLAEGDARRGEFTLDLAAMEMAAGDVLHVRAIARDGNDVSGPGVGVSGTRVLRVARAGEEAGITTLVGFPLEAADDPVLSQRMIILMTEQLRDRVPGLDAAAVLTESNRIGDTQSRLRGQTGEEIYVRLSAEDGHDTDHDGAAAVHEHQHGHEHPRGGHGATADSVAAAVAAGRADSLRIARLLEAASRATGTGTLEESMHLHDASPILSMNTVKLAAFNAMWAAERELRQGRPAASLPHQYEALGYIQQLREADRVFARGRQSVAPIDVAGARGSGSVAGVRPAARNAGEPAPAATAHMAGIEALIVAIDAGLSSDVALRLSALALRMLREPGVDAEAAALVSMAADAATAGDAARAGALVRRARAALQAGGAAGAAPPVTGARSRAAADYLQRLGGRP